MVKYGQKEAGNGKEALHAGTDYQEAQGSRGADITVVSSVWMVFYSFAFTLLYSAINDNKQRKVLEKKP